MNQNTRTNLHTDLKLPNTLSNCVRQWKCIYHMSLKKEVIFSDMYFLVLSVVLVPLSAEQSSDAADLYVEIVMWPVDRGDLSLRVLAYFHWERLVNL